MIPDIRYAKTPAGVHIAYQVVGDGPTDLVWPGPGYSNIDYNWRFPMVARFLRRLGSITRLIVFDLRGTGLSDRIPGGDLPTLESRMEDTLSVMEAVGSERAALWGSDATGPLSILFAATYPGERPRSSCMRATPGAAGHPTIPGRGPTRSGTSTCSSLRGVGGSRITSRSSQSGMRLRPPSIRRT